MDGILLEGVVQNVSRIIGPFLAGVIIKFFGISGCYASLTLISGTALLILFRLSKPAPSAQGSQNLPRRIPFVELARSIIHDQTVLGVLLVTIIMNYLFFPYMTILPVFARDVLGQGPVGLGLLGAGYGIGTFLGLIILNRIRRLYSPNRIYIVGSFFQAAILIVFAVSTSFPLSLFLLLFSGLGQSCFAALQSSIILLSASDELRGRTMGFLNLTIGVGAFGRMQYGALASAFGAPVTVGTSCGAAVLLILVVAAVLPSFRKKWE